MTEIVMQKGPFDEWVDSCTDIPDEVKALMREFRPGTVFEDVKGSGKNLYVTGVGEGKEGKEHAIMLSTVDPKVNYEMAVATQFPVVISALRGAIAQAKREFN